MAVTARRFPGTTASETISGGNSTDWANTGNISADDSSEASWEVSTASPDQSPYLKGTNYGFVDGDFTGTVSTIDGKETRYRRREGSATDNISTNRLRAIKGGVINGTNVSGMNTSEWANSASESGSETITEGGPTNTWNDTWTLADVKSSTTGDALAVDGNGTTPDAYVDFFDTRWYYTVATGSVGTSAGTSTASGAGAATAAASGSVAGIATAAATGASVAAAAGVSDGQATASAVGQAAFRGAGVADGVSTAAAVGVSVAEATGNAAGIGNASGVGASTAESSGSSDGVSSVSGIGASLAEAAGSSAGVATAAAIGEAVVSGVGMADGVASVSGVGASESAAAGVADGTATASAIGTSDASATGLAAGSATAAGIGSSEGGGEEEEAAGGFTYPFVCNVGTLLQRSPVGGGAPPFHETDIADLAALFDSFDPDTLYQDAARTTPATSHDDPIGGWADLSGNDQHAAQSTSGDRPLLKTDAGNLLNGKPTVFFNGSDHYLLYPNQGINGLTDVTLCFCGRLNSSSSGADNPWGFGNSGEAQFQTSGAAPKNDILTVEASIGILNNSTHVVTAGLSDNFVIVAIRTDGTKVKTWLNDFVFASPHTDHNQIGNWSVSGDDYSLGAANDGGRTCGMNIAKWAIYTRDLTETEIGNIFTKWKAETGI